jgi:hypothetical protein
MRYSDLTDDDLAILTQVLARTDALFSPMRAWLPMRLLPNPAAVAIMEQRNAFAADGVPYVATGSAQMRKAAERQLGVLQSWGLLRLGGRSGRRSGVRLTDKGDDFARWFCCVPMYFEAFERCLLRMKALQDHGVCTIGPGYAIGVQERDVVFENDLCGGAYGTKWGPKAIVELESHTSPLFTRGLIAEHVKGGKGWVGWAMTDAGRAAAAGEPPEHEPDFGRWEEARFRQFSDDYFDLVKQLTDDRQGWKPKQANDVFIPGPEGAGWPDKNWKTLPAKLQENWFKHFATTD